MLGASRCFPLGSKGLVCQSILLKLESHKRRTLSLSLDPLLSLESQAAVHPSTDLILPQIPDMQVCNRQQRLDLQKNMPMQRNEVQISVIL